MSTQPQQPRITGLSLEDPKPFSQPQWRQGQWRQGPGYREGEIREWQCHKKVRAGKIVAVEANGSIVEDGWSLMLEGGAVVVVSTDYMSKHRPACDGYYVLYEDGYESFSAAAPFEAGYTVVGTLAASTEPAAVTARSIEVEAERVSQLLEKLLLESGTMCCGVTIVCETTAEGSMRSISYSYFRPPAEV